VIYAGIDPGKDGAVVFLDVDGQIVDKIKTPILKASTRGGKKQGRDEYDIVGMKSILSQDRPDSILITVEKTQAFPSSMGGSAANYQRGFSFGLWQGLMVGLGIPYQVVTPQAWQKVMLAGIASSDTKQAALIAAQRLWPTANWRKSDLAKKADEGFVDAALIGMFGLRLVSRSPEGSRG